MDNKKYLDPGYALRRGKINVIISVIGLIVGCFPWRWALKPSTISQEWALTILGLAGSATVWIVFGFSISFLIRQRKALREERKRMKAELAALQAEWDKIKSCISL